jgi:hypothetical protein
MSAVLKVNHDHTWVCRTALDVRQSPMRKVRRALAEATEHSQYALCGTASVPSLCTYTMFYSFRHTFQYADVYVGAHEDDGGSTAEAMAGRAGRTAAGFGDGQDMRLGLGLFGV